MITIIGKLPLPVGGVTIHVSRLIGWLYKFKYPQFKFIRLNGNVLNWKNINDFFGSSVIHLHTSNPFLRLFISIVCLFFGKKLILTYHGDLLRFNKIKNYFDLLSVKLCTIPIVLNQKSLLIASQYNKNSILLSAFIPPDNTEILSAEILSHLDSLSTKYSKIFCTNAYDLSFDKNGREIYGITDLVNYFQYQSKYALIISDPSGNYKKYLNKIGITQSANILIIDEPHSFYEIIKSSDIFIRNTTTDGDSISVREALFEKKIVLATNCVSRPKGCIVYENILENNLEELLKQHNGEYLLTENVNTVEKLMEIYNQMLA